jgi:hypothetical protein
LKFPKPFTFPSPPSPNDYPFRQSLFPASAAPESPDFAVDDKPLLLTAKVNLLSQHVYGESILD